MARAVAEECRVPVVRSRIDVRPPRITPQTPSRRSLHASVDPQPGRPGPVAGPAFAGKYNKVISVGDKAPAIAGIPAVAGDKDTTLNLADVKEDVVVVVFLANHCPAVKAHRRPARRPRQVATRARASSSSASAAPAPTAMADEDGIPAIKAAIKDGKYNFDLRLRREPARSARPTAPPSPRSSSSSTRTGPSATPALLDDSARDETKVTKTYVKTAVDAVLANETVEITETKASGCGIPYKQVSRAPGRPRPPIRPRSIAAAGPSPGGVLVCRPDRRRPTRPRRPHRDRDRPPTPARPDRIARPRAARPARDRQAGDSRPAEVKLVPVKYDALPRPGSPPTRRPSSPSSTPGRPGAARARRTSRTSSRCTRSTPTRAWPSISLSLDDPDKPKKVAEADRVPQGEEGHLHQLPARRDRPTTPSRSSTSPPSPPSSSSGPTARRSSGSPSKTSNNQFTYDQVEKVVKDYLDGKPIEVTRRNDGRKRIVRSPGDRVS